jgi:hypothetical protein
MCTQPWRPHFYTFGNLDLEVTMDLGPLGKTTSKQSVHRSLLDCFISISNWSLLFVAVLLCKKNPARFIVLILTIAIYLVWMLIINRLNINSIEKIYLLCIFDISLFLLAFSVLLLPILKRMRPFFVLLSEIGLLVGIVGVHLLIYGEFWYRMRFMVLMIAPIAALLMGCKLTAMFLRKKKSMGRYILVFTLSNLFSVLIALTVSVACLYVHQIINGYYYRFDINFLFRYDMKYAYLYFVIFYAAVIPFSIFVCKSRFYQHILLKNETKVGNNTE